MTPIRLAPAALLAALALLAGCAAPRPAPLPAPPVGDERALRFIAVAERIEPVAEAACGRLNPGANCDFLIVVDDRPGMPPNAYQTLDRDGRPILAFTVALIGAVENADELAFIMAHEASHHIAGHLARQAQVASYGAAVFGQLAGEQAGATPASIRRAQMLGAEVGALSYSKEFELEADALGARVAQEAGFDPLRGSAFFLRIPDPGDSVLGTHPSTAERLATVRAALGG